MQNSARRDTILIAILFLLVSVFTPAPSCAKGSPEQDHAESEAPHTKALAHRNHFAGLLRLFAGPGLERSLFEENEYLARVGLGYVFHVEGISVAPLAWVDFVGGHEIYFLGVGVGKAF